jgi:hypothetical protein
MSFGAVSILRGGRAKRRAAIAGNTPQNARKLRGDATKVYENSCYLKIFTLLSAVPIKKLWPP